MNTLIFKHMSNLSNIIINIYLELENLISM